jgi:hypothetical protein
MNTSGWQTLSNGDEQVGLTTGGSPAVRQQFVELLDRVRSDSGEHVLKPCERVHFREFARCHEASQHSHGLAAAVASYERPSCSGQSRCPATTALCGCYRSYASVPIGNSVLFEKMALIRC